MRLPDDNLRDIFQVWLRYFAVFRKSWMYGLMTTVTEPVLFLLAFGFGLGVMIEDLSHSGKVLSYRQFVFAGIVGQAVLLQGFFEGAFGAFIRMYYQRVFQSIAVTPITLSEVLWAEILWDSTRGTFSATVILAIGVATGSFDALGALLAIPICAMGSLLFSAIGVWCAAKSRTIEEINYPQFIFIYPMFLFGGVFFPLENLPAWFQPVSMALPLTGMVEAIRSVTLGLPFPWAGFAILVAWTLFSVPMARAAMTKRLVP